MLTLRLALAGGLFDTPQKDIVNLTHEELSCIVISRALFFLPQLRYLLIRGELAISVMSMRSSDAAREPSRRCAQAVALATARPWIGLSMVSVFCAFAIALQHAAACNTSCTAIKDWMRVAAGDRSDCSACIQRLGERMNELLLHSISALLITAEDI